MIAFFATHQIQVTVPVEIDHFKTVVFQAQCPTNIVVCPLLVGGRFIVTQPEHTRQVSVGMLTSADDRRFAVAITARMRPLFVVVFHPLIEVFLQFLHIVVYLLAKGNVVKLMLYRFVEALADAIALGSSSPRFAVIDVLNGQVELVFVMLAVAAVFGPPVRSAPIRLFMVLNKQGGAGGVCLPAPWECGYHPTTYTITPKIGSVLIWVDLEDRLIGVIARDLIPMRRLWRFPRESDPH